MLMFKFRRNWKTDLIFIAAWLLIASYVLNFWSVFQKEGSISTLYHDEYRFQVDYPSKWRASEFGEEGFKGGKNIRLRIDKGILSSVLITLYQEDFDNPTLNDVFTWRAQSLVKTRANVEDIFTEEELVNSITVIRYRYLTNGTLFEEVMFARKNDMISIRLQATAGEFEENYENFLDLVSSFKTVEP